MKTLSIILAAILMTGCAVNVINVNEAHVAYADNATSLSISESNVE